MSYYLRVEAVNLSHFINDTNDLSTIRGGGLLLLEAMEEVEEIINQYSLGSIYKSKSDLEQQLIEIDTIQNPTQSDKNKKKKLKEKLKKIKTSLKSNPVTHTITKGASWGLFKLDVLDQEACKIQNNVIDYFNKGIRYKHATFVIDIHLNNGDQNYRKDRDSLQTLNHWQQMQSPSLAICKEGIKCCAIDKTRSANTRRYLKNQKYDYVSNSVNQRRKYGMVKKQTFYKKITGVDAQYTQDLDELSKADDKGILNGKIAFIYIDGNSFGNIQKNCRNATEQQRFDKDTREKGREKVLTEILKQIHKNPDWLTKQGKVRLETLLWGGDEIIWAVPAWQGWWMVNEFYKQAKKHIQHDNKPLFHACGLVFCHHDAPIHRIDSLARNLADQFAKADREKNLIAYQILESFDHAGTQLENYRKKRIGELGQLDYLVIDADKMEDIQQYISELKNDKDFAKRKVYQILQEYQEGNTEKAEQYYQKLSDGNKTTLETLQSLIAGKQIHWLHLMDLWDYID